MSLSAMSDCESRFVFTWKIENFSMLPHQKGERLDSPKFVIDSFPNTEWRLWLYPRGEDLESKDNISLFLYKCTEDGEFKVKYGLAVELSTSSKKVFYTLVNNFKNSQGHGFTKFITPDKLSTSKNIYMPNDVLTVCCYLYPADDSMEEISLSELIEMDYSELFACKKCVSRTGIKILRRNLTWSINNVNNCIEKQESVSFEVANVLQEYPGLKLSLNFAELKDNDNIQIGIQQTCLANEEDRLFVKCKITVVGAGENYFNSEESTYLFNLELDDVWKFPLLLESNNFIRDKYLYLDDTLLLHCDFSFSYLKDVYHFESVQEMPLTVKANYSNLSRLSTSIENLYLNQKFCDVTLQSGEETFPTYKVLLCAKSCVFTAMFENDMKEKNSNIVEITDVDPVTLKRMLTYIHTDILEEEMPHEDVCKLYRAADKYVIEYLKRHCCVLLVSKLSEESVCDVLVLVDTFYHDHFLKSSVHNFIRNNATEIFRSSNWKTFMEVYPKLAMSIMHQQWINNQQFNI